MIHAHQVSVLLPELNHSERNPRTAMMHPLTAMVTAINPHTAISLRGEEVMDDCHSNGPHAGT
jgi:hypothetical protein